MRTEEFKNYICWDPEKIDKIINKDAVATERSLFLATHTPFAEISFISSPGSKLKDSEEGFLKELLNRAEKNSHTFAVVQGISGTGKSNLIRWLKEKYTSEFQNNDEQELILLIERANNSLRSTLVQILNTEIFSDQVFDKQRNKLENATSELSKQGLEISILNNFQLGHSEGMGDIESLPNTIHQRLNGFLLEVKIRDELRRDSGAIKRLGQFLSGDQEQLVEDKAPTFEAEDLNLDIQVMFALNSPGVNHDAKDLAKRLSIREDQREILANYLNSLIEFATSETTNLSGNDLKEMFFALRKELKQKGINLTLFIEDITAFTGLDAGLIDILVTQHTGDTNQEFCRLISVVGITDYWFNKRFPDNMRERITHHISLNKETRGKHQSELLDNREVIGEMAARYLNAMRLDQDELEIWKKDGFKPEKLPSFCNSCEHKIACHKGFGAINIQLPNDNKPIEVGLYPFNQSSLESMYTRIETSKEKQTPRTLLNNVIAYVLRNHGNLINAGRFPPESKLMGNDFTPPILENPGERRLLDNLNPALSPNAKEQILSLAVYWGNRTLTTTIDSDGVKKSGGLYREAYEAFSLPFIGELIPVSADPTSDDGPKDVDLDEDEIDSLEPTQTPHDIEQTEDPIINEIEMWRMGDRLQNYGEFLDLLARFLKASIDWQKYNVSLDLIDERLKRSHLAIEGQVGRVGGYYFPFKRSNMLADALEALYELSKKIEAIDSSKLASHILNLEEWLIDIETEIVKFVKSPHIKFTENYSLTSLLTHNNIKLAILVGRFGNKDHDSNDLFFDLISFANSDNSWESCFTLAQESRNNNWVRLMRRFNSKERFKSSQESFKQSLNCSQGQSKKVLYLNAPELLKRLDEFLDNPPSKIEYSGEIKDKTWSNAVEINKALNEHFQEAIEGELGEFRELSKQITEFKGDIDGDKINASFDETRKIFENVQVPFDNEYETLDSAKFDKDIAELNNLVDEKKPDIELLSELSGGLGLKKQCIQYSHNFRRTTNYIKNRQERSEKEIELLISEGLDPTELVQAVIKKYSEIKKALEITQEEINRNDR